MNPSDDLEPRDPEEENLNEELEPLEEDDEARPDRRSDAKDPWHGLNDFDE